MTTQRTAALKTMRSPSLLSFLFLRKLREFYKLFLLQSLQENKNHMIGSENCIEKVQQLVLFQWLWKQLKESRDKLTFSAPSKGTSPRRYDRRFLQITHKQ